MLEKQLKSIEKFYNALSSTETESNKENSKVNLTVNDLVDVAKSVSDQMVLAKSRKVIFKINSKIHIVKYRQLNFLSRNARVIQRIVKIIMSFTDR